MFILENCNTSYAITIKNKLIQVLKIQQTHFSSCAVYTLFTFLLDIHDMIFGFIIDTCLLCNLYVKFLQIETLLCNFFFYFFSVLSTEETQF